MYYVVSWQGDLHAGLAEGGTAGVLPSARVLLPPGVHDRHPPDLRAKVSGTISVSTKIPDWLHT